MGFDPVREDRPENAAGAPCTRTIFSGSSVNRTPATVLEAVGPQEYTLDIESRLRV
ncbi:hypothetical protein ACFWQL_35010 [Amycolatopsis thermoflava]|uniref:hypothetical protein n=1 Tax=Amycolatopsis thermoflava TaxID=84480 RepID=UPI0036518C29